MRVRPTGAGGLLGFLSIDPKDPRVLENSRHAITEAGFGNLIERFGRGYEAARKKGKGDVQIALYEYNRRPCTRIEATYPDAKSSPDGIGRSVCFIPLFADERDSRVEIQLPNFFFQGHPA